MTGSVTLPVIVEAFDRLTAMTGRRMEYEYLDKHREGDHICYISDLTKIRTHYPGWKLTKNLDHIFTEIYAVSIQKSTH